MRQPVLLIALLFIGLLVYPAGVSDPGAPRRRRMK